ncbi:hypothetical protein GCM10023310_56110 [Paenibacillus vulneris]
MFLKLKWITKRLKFDLPSPINPWIRTASECMILLGHTIHSPKINRQKIPNMTLSGQKSGSSDEQYNVPNFRNQEGLGYVVVFDSAYEKTGYELGSPDDRRP